LNHTSLIQGGIPEIELSKLWNVLFIYW
jgi:hypothetical protein